MTGIMYLEDSVAAASEAKVLGLVNSIAGNVKDAKTQAAQLARDVVQQARPPRSRCVCMCMCVCVCV